MIVRPLVSVSRTASRLKSSVNVRLSLVSPSGSPVAANAIRKSLHFSGASPVRHDEVAADHGVPAPAHRARSPYEPSD